MTNSIHIRKFTIGGFAVNNYIVYSERSGEALLIDAGSPPDTLLSFLEENDLNLLYLINTHGHADHISGNRDILRATGAQLLIHEADAPFLSDPTLNMSALLGLAVTSPPPGQLLREGDSIELDGNAFTVLHTPGHTPGHITLYGEDRAFVGDVIFRGGIGRTDLPLASAQQLIESIRHKIYRLPDETVLHPGHGPDTTVGAEKTGNPFVSM